MSTLHKILLSAALLGVALLAGCEKIGDARKAGAPVATVNGKPITQATYDAYAKQRAMSRHPTGDPAEREATIQELINRELISSWRRTPSPTKRCARNTKRAWAA
ncbi:MAG: SurA N-terminal domain-containing protein [Gammaproteobacteria bacterium]|nr:SurA N-terminal domain-containing protein [Gammaproteobacteria bacterium]